jgi:hypothetical protein
LDYEPNIKRGLGYLKDSSYIQLIKIKVMNEKTITYLTKIRYKNATMRATTGELRPRDLIHIARLQFKRGDYISDRAAALMVLTQQSFN